MGLTEPQLAAKENNREVLHQSPLPDEPHSEKLLAGTTSTAEKAADLEGTLSEAKKEASSALKELHEKNKSFENCNAEGEDIVKKKGLKVEKKGAGSREHQKWNSDAEAKVLEAEDAEEEEKEEGEVSSSNASSSESESSSSDDSSSSESSSEEEEENRIAEQLLVKMAAVAIKKAQKQEKQQEKSSCSSSASSSSSDSESDSSSSEEFSEEVSDKDDSEI